MRTFEQALDGLVLERPLGAGAHGEVHLARDPASDRRVALKLLRQADPRRLERFRREAELTARLDHPGIVTVHGAGTYRGRPAIVYALVEGGRPLHEVAPALGLRERLVLVRDVARALAFAHAHGVLHRDVKAENVLVGADGRGRLVDFGLAVAVDSQTLTQTGQLLGTPYALAPEQLGGQELTPASDVWGLGVLLHLVVTGARPFEGESWPALAGAILHGRPARPSSLAPAVPPGVDALVAQALARAPAERPSASVFAAALDGVLSGRGRPRRRRRGPLALSAAAGVALAAAAAGALAASRWPRTSPPIDAPAAPTAARQTAAPAPAAPGPAPYGWAGELATVRSFSLTIAKPLPGLPDLRRVRLRGALGPAALPVEGRVARVPLRLSGLSIDDVDCGLGAEAHPSKSVAAFADYARRLAECRAEALVDGRTDACQVVGLPAKPSVAWPRLQEDTPAFVLATLLPDAHSIGCALGSLLALVPQGGALSLGRRTLHLPGVVYEAEVALMPLGPEVLRVEFGRARARFPRAAPTLDFAGELRLVDGRLAQVRLDVSAERQASPLSVDLRTSYVLELEPTPR